MYSMKLTESELKCLRLISNHGKALIPEIGVELVALRPQVSRVVRSLKEKGFVRTEKIGLAKTVYLSDTKHASDWRSMILELSHVPFEELLSGAALEVLSPISCLRLKGRKEIAECSLVSEATVAKILERLKQVGIVQKKDSAYRIAPRFDKLKDLVTEFRHYLSKRTALEFAGDAVVLWSCGNEFIIETRKSMEEQGFLMTGPSAFGRFGVPLLMPTFYFFHSPFARRLRLEDSILHSLFLENRSMLPILLVWKKNEKRLDMTYLEKQGEKYDAKRLLDEITAYFRLEGRARAPVFPPWNEFQLRSQEYGIS